MRRNYANMDKRKSQDREYVLESIRLDCTELTQDEFIVLCGLSRATYHRWLRENKPPRLTPEQIYKVCKVCRISFNTFFLKLGLDVSAIPKK